MSYPISKILPISLITKKSLRCAIKKDIFKTSYKYISGRMKLLVEMVYPGKPPGSMTWVGLDFPLSSYFCSHYRTRIWDAYWINISIMATSTKANINTLTLRFVIFNDLSLRNPLRAFPAVSYLSSV